MSRGMGMSLAVLGALVAGMTLAPGAHAASGTIALAETDPNWTKANLAGAVYRTIECLSFPPGPKPPPGPGPEWPGWEPPPEPPEHFSRCAWIPYATLGPASEDSCSSPDRQWPALGDGVQLVWSGGEQTGVGSARFDLRDLPLEYGSAAPLLCLSVIEAATSNTFLCVAVFPSPCPAYVIVGRHFQLGSKLLAARSPISESPISSAGSNAGLAAQPAPEQIVQKSRRKRCRKGGPARARSPQSRGRKSSRCARSRGVRKSGTQN